MNFIKMVLRCLLLLFVFSWSNFSLAMQNKLAPGQGNNGHNDNGLNTAQSEEEPIMVVNAEEEEKREELRRCEKERKRGNQLRREDEALRAANHRLLSLLLAVSYGSKFYVRSIRQLGGWLCGHFVLFHAWFLEQQIVINNQTLIEMLNPQNYNYNAFRDFYLNYSIRAYDEQGDVDGQDYLNDVPCPEDDRIRLLVEDQLKQVAGNIGLYNFYVLNNYNEQVNIIASEHPALDRLDPNGNLLLSDLIEECGSLVRYLCGLRNELIRTNALWMVHFACFVGGDHWVLISVVNKTDHLSDTAIIIFDSLNVPIKANLEVQRYINFLQSIFCKNMTVSWIDNLFGWWG